MKKIKRSKKRKQALKVESLNVEIKCPVCLTHWADGNVSFGQSVKKTDFRPVGQFKKADFSFQEKSGLPICPICGFKYTSWTMYALIITTVNRQALEKKSWAKQ